MSNYWLSAIRTLFIFSLGVGMTVLAFHTTYPDPQSCSVAGCGVAPEELYSISDTWGNLRVKSGVSLEFVLDTVYVVDTVKVTKFVDRYYNARGDITLGPLVDTIKDGDEIVSVSQLPEYMRIRSPNGTYHTLTVAEKWAPFENRIIDNIDWGRRDCLSKRNSMNKLACKSSGRCEHKGYFLNQTGLRDCCGLGKDAK